MHLTANSVSIATKNNLVPFFRQIFFGLVKPLTGSMLITSNDGVECQTQNLFLEGGAFTRQQARHEDNKCVCLCNTARLQLEYIWL